MATLQEYSIPVHKSLQQPDLLLGIPKVIVALIFCVTILLVYLFGLGFAGGGGSPVCALPYNQ